MSKINVNSPEEMKEALETGCDGYIPVFQGEEMLAEGALPEVSLENLRRLVAAGLKVKQFIGRNRNVLVEFETGEAYLATGFSFASDDEATMTFAQFVGELDWTSPLLAARALMAVDPDWDTVLPITKTKISSPPSEEI